MSKQGVFGANAGLDFLHRLLVGGRVDLVHQSVDLCEAARGRIHRVLEQALVLIRLGKRRLAGSACRARQVEAVVDHPDIAKRPGSGIEAAIAGAGDGVHRGVGIGRHIVAQQRAVGYRAEQPHAVHAGDLRLQLRDLVNLVVDLGDVVHHLLDGLDQVRDVDDGNPRGVAGGPSDGKQRGDGKRIACHRFSSKRSDGGSGSAPQRSELVRGGACKAKASVGHGAGRTHDVACSVRGASARANDPAARCGSAAGPTAGTRRAQPRDQHGVLDHLDPLLNRGATGQRRGEAGSLEADDRHHEHQHAVARGFPKHIECPAEEAATVCKRLEHLLSDVDAQSEGEEREPRQYHGIQ